MTSLIFALSSSKNNKKLIAEYDSNIDLNIQNI